MAPERLIQSSYGDTILSVGAAANLDSWAPIFMGGIVENQLRKLRTKQYGNGSLDTNLLFANLNTAIEIQVVFTKANVSANMVVCNAL